MALSDIQRQQLVQQLGTFCERRIPLRVRDKVRLTFRVEGHAAVLVEERPYFRDKSIWTKSEVAKFKYVATRREWRLYCRYRERWHEYEPLPTAPRLERLIEEVDQDPTCIFWG